MSRPSPSTSAAQGPLTAVEALEQSATWAHATAEQRVVLKRIAAQRDRLLARRLARQQAVALRAQATSVPLDAPMVDRLAAFVRLHPVASAALAAGALLVGPRKLMRWGTAAWPVVAKFMR